MLDLDLVAMVLLVIVVMVVLEAADGTVDVVHIQIPQTMMIKGAVAAQVMFIPHQPHLTTLLDVY